MVRTHDEHRQPSSSGGFEFDRLRVQRTWSNWTGRPKADLLQRLQCFSCKKLLRWPVKQCANGHLCCSICRVGPDGIGRVCTKCYAPLDNARSAPGVVREFLKDVDVFCKFSDYGCAVRLPATEIDEHEVSCSRRQTPAECPGCRQTLMPEVLRQHWRTCQGRFFVCPLCDLPLRPDAFQDHVRDREAERSCLRSTYPVLKKLLFSWSALVVVDVAVVAFVVLGLFGILEGTIGCVTFILGVVVAFLRAVSTVADGRIPDMVVQDEDGLDILTHRAHEAHSRFRVVRLAITEEVPVWPFQSPTFAKFVTIVCLLVAFGMLARLVAPNSHLDLLQWITNEDSKLLRFTKRRIDRLIVILLIKTGICFLVTNRVVTIALRTQLTCSVLWSLDTARVCSANRPTRRPQPQPADPFTAAPAETAERPFVRRRLTRRTQHDEDSSNPSNEVI